jgi:hypothetical protein
MMVDDPLSLRLLVLSLPDIKKEFKVLLNQIMDVLSTFRNLPVGRNLLLYNATTFPLARLKVEDKGRIFLKLQAWAC